jgi:hypothetical protein
MGKLNRHIKAPIIMKIIKYIRSRFFCKHKMKSVENSKWYFHYKCEKCGYEKGMGNFRYQN